MNTEALLAVIPRTHLIYGSEAGLVIRWSVNRKQFVAGYGLTPTKFNTSGYGETVLEALINLEKKINV